MEKIMEKLLFDMQLSGLSLITQKNYLYHVKRFEEYLNTSVEDSNVEDIRQFLHYLRQDKKLGIGSVNYFHTCLKYLYEITLGRPWDNRKIPRLKGYTTMPAILSRQEVKRLLDSVETMRYKAILSTVYAGGLRISEVCRLRVKDIDSKNMQIFIKSAKGNKDRYTILSNTNLEILREYWKTCGKPTDWMFPGDKEGCPITHESVRNVMRLSRAKAGISKAVTVHTLRHAFATHLLEQGEDISKIKILLGHSSLTSTCKYLHMVNQDYFKVKSPLDVMVNMDIPGLNNE
jgi:integrase/recombinase XerD